MKKFEGWKTDDGKIWETEEAAEMYEARLNVINYFETAFFHGMIECGEDIVNFLDDFKERILVYYGAKEK